MSSIIKRNMHDYDWKSDAIQERKKRHSVKYIAKRSGRTEEEVRLLFGIEDELRESDSHTKTKQQTYQTCENTLPETYEPEWNGNQSITFGLIGDTQLNSKYTQLTYLYQFYDMCSKKGIKDIYHTGDIDDGEQMRMGHQYECYTQGADDHVREIVSVYPKFNGKTHFITGNHDASIFKRCGVDIGKMISASRSDMEYIGRDVARVAITPKCILELRHPWDGTAYALSYKPQKMIESMDADTKPNILAIGHYHKLEYLFYRNVHCFQTGCFQSQTPFTRGKGISVHIGGWIITVEVDENGYVQRIVPEMIPFYKGIVDDYQNYEFLRNA